MLTEVFSGVKLGWDGGISTKDAGGGGGGGYPFLLLKIKVTYTPYRLGCLHAT